MATALDIINLAQEAVGNLGVGEVLSAEESNKSLRMLNMMLGQWNRKRWLIYRLVETSFAMTGAQSYTVGAGGNFNIARPDRLEFAFMRQTNIANPNRIDYPLQILESREDYSAIAIKQLQASPSTFIWYDPAYPLGSVYPWPVPSNEYSLFILTKAVLVEFAALGTTVALPPEYEEALWTNLCLRLAPTYQLPVPEDVKALAKSSRNVLRGANAQIARLTMPPELCRNGLYNIYSDRTY